MSEFKKSTLTEMCKQIKSAPVVFKMKDSTECLAFYNHEDIIQASKLYIIFPNSSMPKYIENNDLYNLRESILHNITKEKALSLYSHIKSHKEDTKSTIMTLIDKAPIGGLKEVKEILTSCHVHTIYNKKHACGWVYYKGKSTLAFMKDLKDKSALELIIDGKIMYNATVDYVIWAAGISAKEFTDLKQKMQESLC